MSVFLSHFAAPLARNLRRIAPRPLTVFVMAVALASMAVAAPRHGRAQKTPTPVPPPTNGVLIVYDDDVNFQSKGYIHALFVENLLGHFKLDGDIISLRDYVPGQLAQYRAAFFIGVKENAQIPAAFLDDVRAYKRPFCWLGEHIGDLVNNPAGRRQYGFTFLEYSKREGATRITYKDTTLIKVEPDLNIVQVNDKRAVEVVATAMTNRGVEPYAIHHGQFWYLADSPFAYPEESGHYLAFCDLLHDILGIQHEASQRALVRVEDVSIDDDPADLRHVADLLSSRHIPFQIAIIPIFRNPTRNLEVRLSDRRSTVDALHYMIAHGGTPIMHGVTHQYRGQSGDDYEFWDDTSDRPIIGDSTEFAMRRLQLGLAECFSVGIYPVAFETPHYAASETDYRAMMRVFSLFYERTMSTPSLSSQQYFPYDVTDRWGRQLIPEDLGYIPEEAPDPKVIVERARALRVVRDGVASFYFHPFLNPKLLDQALQGILDLGYHFDSIHKYASQVDFQDRYVIRTTSGKVRLAPQNEYTRLRLFNREGEEVKTEISSQRLSSKVEIAADVQQGGWAALDCIKELPAQHHILTWGDRTRQWWNDLWAPERDSAAHTFISPKKALILTSGKNKDKAAIHNRLSYQSALETFGYETRFMDVREFVRAPSHSDTMLVVPGSAGAMLSGAQQTELLRFLAGGGQVVADSTQPWLEKVGLQWADRSVTVVNVTDEAYPEMYLRWRPEQTIRRFTIPEDARSLMIDTESEQTLAYSGDYGAGHYVYLAAPLDQYTPDATSHYPYLPKYLSDTFGTNTSLRSPRLEVYFDPAYKPGADLNRLAAQWRKSGIRIVYAAAWQLLSTYSYPYKDFVDACHCNGLAVYAWFNFPMVTPKFWDEHPEWREKTAAGTDGQVGWRYLMNLENPACFRAAMDWTKKFLSENDWDGVNITELNFDADFKDYMRRDKFVPMNNDVRAEFRQHGGFDPILLFSPNSQFYYKENPAALQKFLHYRENIVYDWHRHVLSELEPMRKQQGWEVIVTMMDSLHSKYVRPALGVDSKRLAGLMKDFNFTLQVEDPAEYWMQPPDRYLKFAKTYRKLVKDPGRLMFDVNVMVDRDITHMSLISGTATGIELARTVVAAAAASGRVAV